MPASSTMATTPATASAISRRVTVLLQVVEAERDDDVPPAGQRPDQHPPGMPRGARGGRGERVARAVQLREAVSRAGRCRALDAGVTVTCPPALDHLDQELGGQAAVAGRRGRGPGRGCASHSAGDRGEVAQLRVRPAVAGSRAAARCRAAHHQRGDRDQERGGGHHPDAQRRACQHRPPHGAGLSHGGGTRST